MGGGSSRRANQLQHELNAAREQQRLSTESLANMREAMERSQVQHQNQQNALNGRIDQMTRLTELSLQQAQETRHAFQKAQEEWHAGQLRDQQTINDLRARNAELEARLRAAEQQRDALRETLEKMKAQWEIERAEYQREIKELRERHAQLEDMVKRLMTELQKERADRAEQEEKFLDHHKRQQENHRQEIADRDKVWEDRFKQMMDKIAQRNKRDVTMVQEADVAAGKVLWKMVEQQKSEFGNKLPQFALPAQFANTNGVGQINSWLPAIPVLN